MISKWKDSHQASHLIIGTDSALFVGFCSQRLFMDVKERVSYLKVNGFNWIFQKQKTDNGRNFVPISLINMKVFWDSLQFAVVILIVEKIKHSEPECFAVWRSVKCLLVWRSGHGSPLPWCLYRLYVLTGIVMMRPVFHWEGRVNIYTTSPLHIK